MSQVRSEWQTESLTAAYLEGVRGAIPGAELQMSVLQKIVEVWHPQPTQLLDLGCGDGILGRFMMKLFPMAQVTFLDFSAPMLTAARDKIEAEHRATIVMADFSTPAWLASVAGPYDVIASGFSIHHQPDRRKKELYAEIFDLLNPGGIFLNAEHVSSASPAGQTLFDDYFVDLLAEFHQASDRQKTRQEIADTYYNRPDKKENILAPVEGQCAWLRQIGYEDVDCFFKIFEIAIFGGRKTHDPSDTNLG